MFPALAPGECSNAHSSTGRRGCCNTLAHTGRVNDAQRRRAGRAVDNRIKAMQRTRAGVARAAGIDVKTLRSIIRGERWPSDDAQARLEAVLRWRDGEMTVQAVHSDHAGTLAALSDLDLANELTRRIRDRDRQARRMRMSDRH